MTVLPGLALITEIARRMADLLREAQAIDPFTASTARALVAVGKLTAFAGLGTWALSQLAQGVLCWTMLVSPEPAIPHQGPLGWLAVGLIFAAFGQIIDRVSACAPNWTPSSDDRGTGASDLGPSE